MAIARPRGGSFFSGLILIFVGALLLLHNYHGFDLGDAFKHWWPLVLILFGAVKLYDRAMANRGGDPGAGNITAGEVFLALGLIALVGMVVAVDIGKRNFGPEWSPGDEHSFDLDVAPKTIAPDARITVHNGRGSISVRSSDTMEIRVSGKKNAHAWSETDAKRITDPISVEIAKSGNEYDIHPTGVKGGDSRVSLDLEIEVPQKAVLTIRNEKGDISVSDIAAPVTISSITGNIEIRDTGGDVNIDSKKGDVKISDTKGNVKLSGHGGQVDVISATGSFTLDGEFYGPIRAENIAKGVRFVSRRTDLTLSQLGGHMEASPGNLEVADVPGSLTVRAQDDITIENVTGKLKIDNRHGNVHVRFSAAPKEDVEIDNSSAEIELSLPESASFEITGDCSNCGIESEFSEDALKITEHSGDHHIEGKYGSGHGPKISLKTSHGTIAIRKTS